MKEKDRFNEILAHWQLKTEKIKVVRDVLKVTTAGGDKCLKKVNEKPEKLIFIASALNHLKNRGFKNFAGLELTNDGQPFVISDGQYWVLSPWLLGREPEYHKGDEMAKAAATLAEFHQAAEGYEPPSGCRPKNKLGKWIKKLESKAADLDHYRRMVDGKDEHDHFDREFFAKAEWLNQKAQESIKVLKKSPYLRLCSKQLKRKGLPLCHGDTAARNFIIDHDNNAKLIDFDSLAVDLKIIDLWRLLRRTMRKSNWSMEQAKQVINSYNDKYPLSKEEYQVLYAFLLFPEKPWRIAKEYYEKEGLKHGWNALNLKRHLSYYLDQQRDYEVFLEQFAQNYC